MKLGRAGSSVSGLEVPWYTIVQVTIVKEHRGRFLFVDGLRGLAALAVVGPHAVAILATGYPGWLSRVLMTVAPYGAYGVEVFFVISGFAIAHSLLDASFKNFSIGRFVLRRAVRLDPPYWAALLLLGALNLVRATANHRALHLPDAGQVLAHVFYLQDLLGYAQFNVVFWTLCLEFQLCVACACVTSRLVWPPARLRAPSSLCVGVRSWWFFCLRCQYWQVPRTFRCSGTAGASLFYTFSWLESWWPGVKRVVFRTPRSLLASV